MKTYKKYRLEYPSIGSDVGSVLIEGPPKKVERRSKLRYVEH